MALVLLTGCTAQEQDTIDAAAFYSTLNGLSAHTQMTADLGQSVLEYETDYTYHQTGGDQFTVTAPQSVAGIGGTIAEENGSFTLTYDGAILDDATTVSEGLSPADGLFCLLRDLRDNTPVQQWTETTEGRKLAVLQYRIDTDKETIEKQIWLDAKTLLPVYAELYTDGNCVLTIRLSDCEIL